MYFAKNRISIVTFMKKLINIKSFIAVAVCISTLAPLYTYANRAYNISEEEKKEETDSTKTENKYKQITTEGKTLEGFFNVHKVKNDYYFEIPDSLIGRDMLLVNKISGVNNLLNEVGVNNGLSSGEKLIRFRRDTAQGKVYVAQFQGTVSAPKGDAISQSVESNYQESIIEYFDIEAYNPDSTSVVVKVNKVFDGQEKSFNNIFDVIGTGGAAKSKLSKIESAKSFPRNIIIKSLLSSSHSEGGASVPLSVKTTSNIVLLDKEPMMPRYEDIRVGYFSVPHLLYNDQQQKVEKRNYVTRWRLEPKSEDVEKYLNGELVEPQKPIVFYIDPATPPMWVDYIKKGVEEWQEAFETAGFKNAIYALEVDPKSDTDFDIDDIRYSVITYVASEKANAMGPSIIDPRSGEIIEADIIWWHNVMTALDAWIKVQTGAVDQRAQKSPLPSDLMGNAVRFVSSHELGHSLGLRHNMGASYSIPVDSLRSKSYTDANGTASSIMDYARFNYVAQPEDNISSLTPQIGAYDKHAIEWAYRWYDATSAKEELPTLRTLVDQREEDIKYWYGEQQALEATIDPRSQIEDLGDDAIAASNYGITNLKRLIPNVTDWTFKEGDLQYEAGEFLMAIISQWNLYATHVMSNIGGYHINNITKGDNLDRFVPIDREYQKRAVDFLVKEVFSYPEWLFGADAWNKTYIVRSSPLGMVETAPLNMLRNLQYSFYYYLLDDERMNRMFEMEAQKGVMEAYRPDQMLAQITETVFENANKELTIFDRVSQKNYVDALIVSSNITMVKTTKKGMLHHKNCGCQLMSSRPEIDFERLNIPRPSDLNSTDKMATLYYGAMQRTSESTSAKRGELRNILKIAEGRTHRGDTSTRNHYQDLELRIKEALKEVN